MEYNKPKIEDDFKNLICVFKTSLKVLLPMFDFKIFKDYDIRSHIGFFLIYNIFYILATFIIFLNTILGGELVRNDMTFIGFTERYFLTGEFITFDAWRIHLLLNVILIFNCLDYGKTELNRELTNKGWRPEKENGKD